MSLTIPELEALSFGYLTGADLTDWSAPQLLIKQYEVSGQKKMAKCCAMAYEEVTEKLKNRYDLNTELAKDGGAIPDTRAQMIVKITSIFAVRNILGNAQNVSENMVNTFEWADKTVRDMRGGQDSASKLNEANNKTIGSPATLINSSFNYIG
jgi:hypothetical protein